MIPLRESNLVHLIEKLLLLRASQIYDSVKSQTFFPLTRKVSMIRASQDYRLRDDLI